MDVNIYIDIHIHIDIHIDLLISTNININIDTNININIDINIDISINFNFNIDVDITPRALISNLVQLSSQSCLGFMSHIVSVEELFIQKYLCLFSEWVGCIDDVSC